ncbi:hypothetical protein M3Y94_00326400 [Aphelenchoides besseyi]|nr:hypothetical protein M3Y94_00326400 [Aphelenchoides besseyi]
MTDDFTESVTTLIATASGHNFSANDRKELFDLITDCNKIFLKRLIRGAAKISRANQRCNVTYDDLAELIHEKTSFAAFKDTIPNRITIEEVQARHRKEEASNWAYDYTHFNRHKQSDDTNIKLVKKKLKPKKKRSSENAKNLKSGKIRRKSSSSKSGSPKKRVLKKMSK